MQLMIRKFLLGQAAMLVAICLAAVSVFAEDYFLIEYDEVNHVLHPKKIPRVSAADNMHLIDSGSVLVMDAVTGRVILEIDGYSRRYPASVTKVMTAIIVLENVDDLDETVWFSRNAVNLPWYAARMWMVYGETLTVRDILYGLMLSSGNDLARAVAEHVSGSIPAFVDEMNRRAVEIGAYNTRFVNPCGLPGDGQYITAYDIALIMKHAIQIPKFVEIINTAYYDFPPTFEHVDGRVIRNTHRMLRQYFEYEFDPRIVGGKTGFTNAAQHTLVSYARSDEFNLIISVLYSPNRTTFTDTRLLMDHAFGQLRAEREEAQNREVMQQEQGRIVPVGTFTLRGNQNLSEPGTKVLQLTPVTISDTEALAIAASSLGIAVLSLGIIKLIYSRKDY